MGLHVLLFLLIEYSQIVLGNRLLAALLEQRGWTGWSPEALSNLRHPVKVQCLSMLRCMQPVGYRGILHTSARLFCQVLSKSRYSFVYPLYSSSLSRNKLLFFHPAHRGRKSLFWFCLCHFTVSCQWEKLPCLSFFLPFMPVPKAFEILFSYQSSMANIVSNATTSELSFHFPSMFSNSYLDRKSVV